MSEIQQKLELIRLQFDNLEMMLNSSASQPSEHSPMVLKFSNGVQLGIDARGRFHLLLALSKSEEKIRSKLTAGIVIRTQTYAIGGVDSPWVDIIAEKRWRWAMEPFAAEVISEMVNDEIQLDVLRRIVDEHRALWAPPSEPLTRMEQKGLIAELLVVQKLGEVMAPATAISKWRGPDRGLHDIADERWAIEVKSYADEPPRVRIHHIEQLDHRLDKRLTLVGVHLYPFSEGKSLPDFIDDALQWADKNDCRPHLEENLARAKWRDEDRADYFSTYDVGRMVAVPIRPETPVFPSELKDEIPSSVSEITYLLHLNDLEQLPTDLDSTWGELTSPHSWGSLSE